MALEQAVELYVQDDEPGEGPPGLSVLCFPPGQVGVQLPVEKDLPHSKTSMCPSRGWRWSGPLGFQLPPQCWGFSLDMELQFFLHVDTWTLTPIFPPHSTFPENKFWIRGICQPTPG